MTAARNGLANLGNTCFINSILQCLRCTPLVDILRNHQSCETKQKQLVHVTNSLFAAMQSTEEICVRPISIIKLIYSDQANEFLPNSPGDAHELYCYFISTLHDQISRKVNITIRGSPTDESACLQLSGMKSFKSFFEKSYSTLLSTFYGQVLTCIKSCETPFETSVFEPFMSLHVPIKNVDRVNLYDCLDVYFESERLDKDRLFYDDAANKYVTAIKRHYVWKCPDVLVITLMRFGASHSRKDNRYVRIPELLNFSKYMHNQADQKQTTLRLIAVCNHSGSNRGGHYVALCRDGNVWTEYDDESVIVKKNFKCEETAYVLFFQKQNQ